MCGSCAIFRTLWDNSERYIQARWLAGKGVGVEEEGLCFFFDVKNSRLSLAQSGVYVLVCFMCVECVCPHVYLCVNLIINS